MVSRRISGHHRYDQILQHTDTLLNIAFSVLELLLKIIQNALYNFVTCIPFVTDKTKFVYECTLMLPNGCHHFLLSMSKEA